MKLRDSQQLGEALRGAGLRCRPRNFRQEIPLSSRPGRSRDQRQRRPANGRLRRRQGFGRCGGSLALGIVFALGAVAAAAQSPAGTWAMSDAGRPGYVMFSLTVSRPGFHMQEESDWSAASFPGVDLATAARHDVKFAVTRDAGRLECDGFLEGGEGAGIFHFFADSNYPRQMAALGFGGIDAEMQFAMAVHDVSLAFAREMKNERITGLNAGKLLAFRIHGVDKAFIDGLRSAGLEATDSDKLIAFRIHGVSPAFVAALRRLGYARLAPDQLIAFRIHGISPDFVSALGGVGYGRLEPDTLIAFRIHGVLPAFVAQLAKLGYRHPSPDQLVAMRIHGVTPEYIAGLRSRGMRDLTVDQLINLRIHGID